MRRFVVVAEHLRLGRVPYQGGMAGGERYWMARMHRSMARWLIGRPDVQAVVVPA